MSKDFMAFLELIIALERFWAGRVCIIQQPYDVEVGALIYGMLYVLTKGGII